MTITLGEAIRRLRSLLNEPAYPTLPGSTTSTGGQRMYTDTELSDWINGGLRDISRRAEDLITFDTSIQIPAYTFQSPGQPAPAYPLLTDIIRIWRVEFIPTVSTNQIYVLDATNQREMDQIWGTYQQSSSTYPRWWMTRGYPGGTGRNQFLIQIYPNPSQTGTLNIFYYRLPTYISDPVANPAQYQVTLDIIAGWEDLVVEYAHYKALIKARDPSWQQIKSEYEEKVTQMIDVTRKFTDQQSYVSYGNSYAPTWLTSGGEW